MNGCTQRIRWAGRLALVRFLVPILSILATIGIVLNAIGNRPGDLPPQTRGWARTCIAQTKGNGPVRLIPFEYSTSDAYILELGDKYVRFFRNKAPVLSGGVPYEVDAPWDANDLFEIQYAQDDEDAQTMRFRHRDYPPYKLTRNSHTDWALVEDDSHEK